MKAYNGNYEVPTDLFNKLNVYFACSAILICFKIRNSQITHYTTVPIQFVALIKLVENCIFVSKVRDS